MENTLTKLFMLDSCQESSYDSSQKTVTVLLDNSVQVISLLKDSNFALSLLLPVFLALACVLFLLRIFLLISGVIHGTEEVDLLVSEGICFSADS